MRVAAYGFLIVVLVTTAADAATVRVREGRRTSPDHLWTELSSTDVSLTFAEVSSLSNIAVAQTEEVAQTRSERVYTLNVERMDGMLRDAPQRPLLTAPAENGRQISVPLADGRFQRFAVYSTSVIPSSLAAAIPDLKTFAAVAVDDPTTTASIERTADGWSAMIVSPTTGTSFVTPLFEGQKDLYIAARKAPRVAPKPFRCFVEGSSDRGETTGAERKLPKSFGGTSRTYRLAIAATGEYTNFFRRAEDSDDQAKRRALSEIVRLVARLNQVYSRELAIQFVLIPKELDIIYTDAAHDPYTNDNPSKLLDENEANLDKVLGTDGYDIGHVVGTGGGGLASLRSTCTPGSKARGETGSDSPTSDSFYIDYVAHEVGHQFGGNHTFNAITANCSGNRRAAAAYEPGSGTTIMGYAGICGSEDVSTNSSDYFHAVSFDEIVAHITGDGACATSAPNGDRPPAVALEAGRVLVPIRTPFALRAIGSDPDNDGLTYSFEQYDLGDAAPPDDDSDGKIRPMFRSTLSVAPNRMFPNVTNIAGAVPSSVSFEALPVKSPALSFRVLARDQRGGFAFADGTVAIVPTAGPFRVTSPSATTTWKSASTVAVTWDVAATTTPPLSCTDVRLAISLDGASFVVLLPSTPNDGSENVTVPSVVAAKRATLVLEAVGQGFFAASPIFSVVP
jgi:hypothetical protein